MKTPDDIVRHILDYDSEETVALTFKTKSRLVRNIVFELEHYYQSVESKEITPLTDEEIEKGLRDNYDCSFLRLSPLVISDMVKGENQISPLP